MQPRSEIIRIANLASKELPLINIIQWEIRIFTIHHWWGLKVEETPPSHSGFCVCFKQPLWNQKGGLNPQSLWQCYSTLTNSQCFPSISDRNHSDSASKSPPKKTDFEIYIKRWDESRLQSAEQGVMEEKKKWRDESEVNTHTDRDAEEANSWALLPPSGWDENWNSASPKILYFLFFITP